MWGAGAASLSLDYLDKWVGVEGRKISSREGIKKNNNKIKSRPPPPPRALPGLCARTLRLPGGGPGQGGLGVGASAPRGLREAEPRLAARPGASSGQGGTRGEAAGTPRWPRWDRGDPAERLRLRVPGAFLRGLSDGSQAFIFFFLFFKKKIVF